MVRLILSENAFLCMELDLCIWLGILGCYFWIYLLFVYVFALNDLV